MGVKIASVLFFLWLLNLTCAYFGYPWAFWLWQGLWRYVLQPVASLGILACALYFLGALVIGSRRQALIAALLMFLIGGADGFARALLTVPG